MNYFLSSREYSEQFYRVFLICSLILFANFFHSFGQTEIVKWDFDDEDSNPGNSLTELNLTDEMPVITANTGSGTGFDLSNPAIYYTRWDSPGLYYEISFNGEGYQSFNLSIDFRSTSTGPNDIQIYYSSDNGETIDLLESTETGISITDNFSTHTFDFNSIELKSSENIKIRLAPQTQASNGSGRFYLDNIIISAEEITPTQLVISNINNGQLPVKNQPFEVTIEAQDDDGLTAVMSEDTDIALHKISGNGIGNIISGNTGLFQTGNRRLTLTITYDSDETGVVFEPSIASGASLSVPASSEFTVIDTEPSNPPISLSPNVLDANSVELEIERNDNPGESILIIGKKDSPLLQYPQDGVHYNANTDFGSGTEIEEDAFVIYSGSNTTTTISNLEANSSYYFYAFEFNGNDGTENYLSIPVETSFFTCLKPTYLSTNIDFENVTSSSFDLTWDNGGGENRLVLMNSTNAFAEPTDGLDPSEPNNIWQNSGEQIIYFGNDPSIDVYGLSPNTSYYFRVYEVNCFGIEIKYSSDFVEKEYVSLYFFEDFQNCIPSGWSNILIRGNSWTCQNGFLSVNGNHPSSSTESWLISPSIDFSSMENATLSFISKNSGLDEGEEFPQLKVLYSDLYPGYGNPALETYEWEELPYIPSDEGSNEWGFSGLVDLSDKISTSGYVAFQYVSSGNSNPNSSTWSIDNVTIESRECEAPKIQAKELTINELTENSAQLTWENGNGHARIVVVHEGSEITNNPVNGIEYTANPVYGSGDEVGEGHYVVYKGTGNSVNITGLFQEMPYTVKAYEYGFCKNTDFEATYNLNNGSIDNPTTFQTQNPLLSDIIEDPNFAYPTKNDFSYLDYQTNDVESNNSLELGKFLIRDRNNDGLTTLLSEIEFEIIGWNNLNKIALYQGETELSEVDSDDQITFSGLNIETEDEGESELSIRVSYSENVLDNSQFQAIVIGVEGGDPPNSFTPFNSPDAGGARTSNETNVNTINVVADRLIFSSIPSASYVDVPFQLTVQAADELNNHDQDATGTVQLLTNGTGFLQYEVQNLTHGQAEFVNLAYNREETIALTTQSNFSTEAYTELTFQNILSLFEFTGYHTINSGEYPATWNSEFILPPNFEKGGDVKLFSTILAEDVFSCRGFTASITKPQDHYYLEFSVTPTVNQTLNIEAIQFKAKRSGSGPQNFVFRSNEDDFETDLGVGIYDINESFSTFQISLSQYDNISEEVVFRIYPYNGSHGNGSLQIDDLVVIGQPNDGASPEFLGGYPRISLIHSNGYDFDISASEPGKVYIFSITHGETEPTIQEIMENPTVALDMTEAEEIVNHEILGLEPSQAFDLYFVLEDNTGNYASESSSILNVVTSNTNSTITKPLFGQIQSMEISSVANNPEESIEVFSFTINDNSDEAENDDGLDTHVSQIYLTPGPANTADWESVIGDLQLKNASTGDDIPIQETAIVSESIIIRFATDALVISNNSEIEVTLSIWLSETVHDHQVLQFKIDGNGLAHNCLTDYYNSSQFEEIFDEEILSGEFTINVIATELAFSDYPSSYTAGELFGITIHTVDENGNLDMDEDNSEIMLELYSGAGMLTGDELTKYTESGIAEWTNELDYSGATDFFSIQATINGLALTGSFHTNLITAGSNDLVILSGETFTVSGAMTINGFVLIEEGGTLILSQNSHLVLSGNFTNNGVFTDQGGILEFNGLEAQIINSSEVLRIQNLVNSNTTSLLNETEIRIVTSLKLNENSILDVDGTNDDRDFILLSNANRTASLRKVESGAQLNGEITWQHFVDNKPAQGWYFMTTPIKNQNVTHWQDDLRIQGMDNSLPNADKVMYHYEEPLGTNSNQGTEGWLPITQSDYELSQKSVDFFIFNSAFKKGALKLDNKGIPFIGNGEDPDGNFIFSLSYTETAFDGGGWNLVANPYPSEMDWDLIEKTNEINNSFAIWDPVNLRYSSYVDGTSVNEGSQIIPAGKSFFVKASSENQSLTFSEDSKTQPNPSFLRTNHEQNIVRIRLRSPQFQTDETVIKFKDEASFDFDPEFDALKLEGDINVFSNVEGYKYCINSIPKFTGVHNIPLNVRVNQSGIYKIEISKEDIDWDQNIYLIDHQESKPIRILPPFTKTFKVDLKNPNSYLNRFELLFAEQINLSLKAASTDQTDEISVLITADHFKDVSGMEMSFSWNEDELELLDIDSISIPSIKPEDFDVGQIQNGILHLKWSDDINTHNLDDQSILFVLKFRNKGNFSQSTISLIDSTMRITGLSDIEFPVNKLSDATISMSGIVNVSGKVLNPFGDAIEGIKVTLDGDRIENVLSNELGEFSFNLSKNHNYSLSVDSDSGNHLEGINLIDYIQLKRHLNKISLLQNPYQLIAADANVSKDVDVEDLEAIKNLILKKTQLLPLDQSWIFMPDTNNLDENPFEYKLNYSFTLNEELSIDFTALKIGDIDLSYWKSSRPIGGVSLVSNLKTTKKTNEYLLQFQCPDQERLLALQITMVYDPREVEILAVHPDNAGGRLDTNTPKEGKMILMWEEGNGQAIEVSDKTLFNLKLRSVHNESPTGKIEISEDPAETYLIDGSENILWIAHSENITGLGEEELHYQLLQNYPNPFSKSTTFKIYVPRSENVLFAIFNVLGTCVYKIENHFEKGWHEITWQPEQQTTGHADQGVYFYSIRTDHFMDMKKMVVE